MNTNIERVEFIGTQYSQQQDGKMIEKNKKSAVLEEMVTYYATPNEYADRFMAYLTSDEWIVVSYACRRIFGFHQKQDHISTSQFANGAMKYDGSGYRDRGTGLCKSSVTKALQYLCKIRLIKIVAHNNPRTNKGVLWSLELDYDKVDMAALIERFELRQRVKRDRMEKPRASRKKAVIVPINE